MALFVIVQVPARCIQGAMLVRVKVSENSVLFEFTVNVATALVTLPKEFVTMTV
jgi:hypothetical protein